MCNIPPTRISIITEIHWVPFCPDDWRNSGSCYPCLIWDTATDTIYTLCDPWTLPSDDDYSNLLCAPTKALIPERRRSSVPNGERK
jgi:hypothetical protein